MAKTAFDYAKAMVTPIARGHGLIPKRSKDVWVDDNGFYLTVLELQPFYGEGFFVNVHIKFMWRYPTVFTYDFTPGDGDGRIAVEDSPLQAVMYRSPNFERAFDQVMSQSLNRINDYRAFRDLDALAEALRNRRDLFYHQNPTGYREEDPNLGVVEFLRGDRETAMRIFRRVEQQYSYMPEYLAHSDTVEEFRAYITEHVADTRQQFAQKYHFRLPR